MVKFTFTSKRLSYYFFPYRLSALVWKHGEIFLKVLLRFKNSIWALSQLRTLLL